MLEYKQYLYSREVEVFTKIKEIFISHFGLAEPSTKENYRDVVIFIENRNIINVTERKLDITFTGEDVSGLRGRIESLYENLSAINAQIRAQLESAILGRWLCRLLKTCARQNCFRFAICC